MVGDKHELAKGKRIKGPRYDLEGSALLHLVETICRTKIKEILMILNCSVDRLFLFSYK